MSDNRNPLDGRAGLTDGGAAGKALARELGQLLDRRGLLGGVLITFTRDGKMGVNSSGETDLFLRAMTELGDRILADIDDGKYDPTVIHG